MSDFFPDSALLISTLSVFMIAWGSAFLTGRLLLSVPWLGGVMRPAEAYRADALSTPVMARLGGIMLGTGFFIALSFDNRLAVDTPLKVLALGAVLALGFGLMDDIAPMRWCWQLIGQLLLGGLLVGAGMEITHVDFGSGWTLVFDTLPIPFFAGLVTLFWVLLVMNALNWLDGVDGLMGSVGAVTIMVLIGLSLRPEVNQPALVLLGAMLLGSLTGFLALNWFPARVMAGTGGVYFLGFLISALSVYAGTKVATALLVLALPVLDLVSVVLTRLRHKTSLFLPDHNHLHHILLSLGFSPRVITSIYILITSLMGLLALSTHALGKLGVLICSGLVFFGALAWMQWMIQRKV